MIGKTYEESLNKIVAEVVAMRSEGDMTEMAQANWNAYIETMIARTAKTFDIPTKFIKTNVQTRTNRLSLGLHPTTGKLVG
jgi:hypothetical protein